MQYIIPMLVICFDSRHLWFVAELLNHCELVPCVYNIVFRLRYIVSCERSGHW